jgi:alpha-D-ribose 1-methylphosphonate 5-triphosphate diphosphatase
METILTNAGLVTEAGIIAGTLVHAGGVIRAAEPGRSHAPGAVDVEGDFLAPGLIECHTDNLERHFLPRPNVIWPNALAAALGHDSQMAAAGVTTVYDAVSVGFYDSRTQFRKTLFRTMIDAVQAGVREKLFRLDHRIHLRCELSDPGLIQELETDLDLPLVKLASLMDHTPGQRQWRDPSHLRAFIRGQGVRDAEIDVILAERVERAEGAVQSNWPRAVELMRGRGILLASHDDTTEAHVAAAAAAGCTISEFPTTLEAARAARRAGMRIVAGAPNVVRGGSHTGGVAARELAAEGLLDTLPSDYVPASLLQSVRLLADDPGLGLAEAIGLVTWRVADMLGLPDRGRLETGLRADVVRFRFAGDTPVVKSLVRAGERVF